MFTDIIPEMLTEVNQPPEKKEFNPDNLSKADRAGYNVLEWKYFYWKNKNELKRDGSFFYVNADFARGAKLKRRGAIRLKQRLRDQGAIRYRTQTGRKGATYYWLPVYDKKEGLKTIEQPEKTLPIDPEAVRAMVKTWGKKWVLNCAALKAYTQAEIEACFET